MAMYVGSAGQHVILYVAFVGSMLAGASAVHWLLEPDVRLPRVPPVALPAPPPPAPRSERAPTELRS
jgi:hypothetical protein